MYSSKLQNQQQNYVKNICLPLLFYWWCVKHLWNVVICYLAEKSLEWYQNKKCVEYLIEEKTKVFFRLFIYALQLEIQLSRGESWDPVNRFNPPLLAPVPSQDLNCQLHMSWSLCSVKLRGGCSFCWYWWNWWPLLFKQFFRKRYRMLCGRNNEKR